MPIALPEVGRRAPAWDDINEEKCISGSAAGQ